MNRRHRGIGRFQHDVALLSLEALERDLAIDHSHHAVAVIGRILLANNHQVAIFNVIFDHRLPLTLRAKQLLPQKSWKSTSSSFCSMASIVGPAATRPSIGSMGPGLRWVVSWIARASGSSGRLMNPFFSKAFRWHITPLGDLILKAVQISRIDGP